ncbi:hypothetical protein LOK49_LG15G00958 [Camellia lanceoleosa]|uniref:Uncharacterized protein n=1 Tax=Camellia lanceoleosa TaxID=1840588 RepID=A0ACC0F486_9ERIC|nr:hypothetical protein LOK49_LG15G00958 [Camellia lanceoleosa]
MSSLVILLKFGGVVLFPEATLPLRVIQPNFITAIERALCQVDTPYTIGVVHRDPDNWRMRFATVGMTAEGNLVLFQEKNLNLVLLFILLTSTV